MTSLIHADESLQQRSSIFFDNVLLYADSLEDMQDLMDRLFKILRNANLFLHPEKSSFLPKNVDYLGFTFDEFGYYPQEGKLKAMLACPRPINRRSLKSFLGLISFYKSFQPQYVQTACILQSLLS